MTEVLTACSPEELAVQLQPGMRLDATYGDRVVSFTVEAVGMRWITSLGNKKVELFPDTDFATMKQQLPNGKTLPVSRSLQELSDHDVRIVPPAE